MGDCQYEYLMGVLNINRRHEYINRCREYIICIQILTYKDGVAQNWRVVSESQKLSNSDVPRSTRDRMKEPKWMD